VAGSRTAGWAADNRPAGPAGRQHHHFAHRHNPKQQPSCGLLQTTRVRLDPPVPTPTASRGRGMWPSSPTLESILAFLFRTTASAIGLSRERGSRPGKCDRGLAGLLGWCWAGAGWCWLVRAGQPAAGRGCTAFLHGSATRVSWQHSRTATIYEQCFLRTTSARHRQIATAHRPTCPPASALVRSPCVAAASIDSHNPDIFLAAAVLLFPSAAAPGWLVAAPAARTPGLGVGVETGRPSLRTAPTRNRVGAPPSRGGGSK